MRKMRFFLLVSIFAAGCKKDNSAPTLSDTPITVRASVINKLNPGKPNEGKYWQAGVIFDKAITASGTAKITWYFGAGQYVTPHSLDGHYSQTIAWTVNNSASYGAFTEYLTDQQADSIKLTDFTTTSNYNITVTK